jgi:hypothetical protein
MTNQYQPGGWHPEPTLIRQRILERLLHKMFRVTNDQIRNPVSDQVTGTASEPVVEQVWDMVTLEHVFVSVNNQVWTLRRVRSKNLHGRN